MMKLKEMSLEQRIDYWTGYVCLAIGRGDMKGAIGLIIMQESQDSYDCGFKNANQELLDALKTWDNYFYHVVSARVNGESNYSASDFDRMRKEALEKMETVLAKFKNKE